MTNNNDNIPTLHFPEEITDLLTLISEQQTAQIRLCRTLLAGFKAANEQDIYYMDQLMDPLMDFMDQGDETEDLYRDYIAHIASFDAQEGQKRFEDLEEHLGYWAKTVYAAAHVAKQLHEGQQDENGADYFKEHVYKVGSSAFSWKQQVAGFLHAAAEEGQYTVLELLDLVKRQIAIWNQDTLSALKDEARMREYDSAFFWLDDARIANICYNTTAPNIGLQLNEDRTTLKCYFCDTGLLISLAFNARGIVSNEIYQKLMFDKLEINEGMLVENIVAQMLKATDKKLYFYSNYDKEVAKNRMEIDFLIQKETVTSRHNISPIEVKSSTNYTLTSIKKCIEKYGPYLSTPYVLHSKDVGIKNGLVYLPLYMTPLL